MQSRFRWQTLLSFSLVLMVLLSTVGYFYWTHQSVTKLVGGSSEHAVQHRPFRLDQLAAVDRPSLVKTISLVDSGDAIAWNARGDLIAVAQFHDVSSVTKKVVSLYSIDGEYLRQFEAEVEHAGLIAYLEWHPTKDILAVSYGQSLILWSVDGTIIKRIDNSIESSFRNLSWNPATNELAVVDYYAYNSEYYCQIVLFDEEGTKIRRIPHHFNLIDNIGWINQANIIVNAFGWVYSFNTRNEKLQPFFDQKFWSVDVNGDGNLIVGISENNANKFTVWHNGTIELFQIPQIIGREYSTSARGEYTVFYPSDSLTLFNHQQQQFDLDPSIKFDGSFRAVAWHKAKPMLVLMLQDELQLWQFPE